LLFRSRIDPPQRSPAADTHEKTPVCEPCRRLCRSGGIARPAIIRAASATTLKFVPYADLALLDPLVSPFVTRNHESMFEPIHT